VKSLGLAKADERDGLSYARKFWPVQPCPKGVSGAIQSLEKLVADTAFTKIRRDLRWRASA
jgi:hypothetical protein